MWAKKYPILTSYQEEVEVERHAGEMKRMLESLKRDYGYNDTRCRPDIKRLLVDALKNSRNLRQGISRKAACAR